jgi:hypothetical protein
VEGNAQAVVQHHSLAAHLLLKSVGGNFECSASATRDYCANR